MPEDMPLTTEQYTQGREGSDAIARKLNERLVDAIGKLGEEFRSKGNGNGNGNGHSIGAQLILLVAVSGIMFGLMTPLYIMVQTAMEAATNLRAAMAVDDLREKVDAAALATLASAQIEVKTQFSGVKANLDRMEATILRDDEKIDTMATDMATMAEKLRAIEQRGRDGPAGY